MRYASIRSMDISNGEGVGISLFVQGCHFHCKNCFNPETWDFNGGKEWTPEVEDKFIELASRPYIKRISILGGEPLADENLDGVLNLVNRFRLLLPEKTIWLYTGYTFESIFSTQSLNGLRLINIKSDGTMEFESDEKTESLYKRQQIILSCDVLVDGRYIDSQRDVSLRWRGSKNQRVIDIKQTINNNKLTLFCN